MARDESHVLKKTPESPSKVIRIRDVVVLLGGIVTGGCFIASQTRVGAGKKVGEDSPTTDLIPRKRHSDSFYIFESDGITEGGGLQIPKRGGGMREGASLTDIALAANKNECGKLNPTIVWG